MSNRTPYLGQSITHDGIVRHVTSVRFHHSSRDGRIVTTAVVTLDHVVQFEVITHP